MKPKFTFLPILGLGAVLMAPAATYKGVRLDGKHFHARIKVKEAMESYPVDVVFVHRAANIAFPDNIPPALKSKLMSGRYLTLYLFQEEIENPDLLVVRQVKPPLILDNRDPADWETDVIWEMEVELK